jgi:outer membrane lipase/esterase
VPASLVPILGRFTTSPGPIWAEILARDYGVSLLPSNVAGGTDFAQGGARVATNSASTPPGAAQRPVTTQIGEYLARGAADPNALYTVWAGANDVLQILGGASAGVIPADQVSVLLQGAAAAEVGQIARLRAAGARNIMVFGLPNIGATPGLTAAGPVASGTATALSSGFNTALFVGLAQQGIRVIPVDAFSFLTEIRANPTAFGFSNITTPACRAFPPFSSAPDALFCPPSALVTADANRTFLFADGIHPTSAGHAIIAQFAESLINGPTQYSLLAEAPLRARAGNVRALAEGLAATRADEVGRWTVFVAGDRSDYDVDPSIGYPALKSRNYDITIGASARMSETFTLGAAYSRNKIQGSFNGNSGSIAENPGSFDAEENVVSLFAAMKWGGFYGTGIVSVGDLHFNNVNRNVVLGPMIRTSNSRTSGANASAAFTAGYDFKVGPVMVGPTIGVVSQNVDVDGFDEVGMASSNLRIGKQNRKSEVWSAGVRLSANVGSWTPWIKVTADKERRDDARLVTAAPLSILAGGLSYDVTAYAPDTTFMTGSIGVRGTLTENVGVSFAYYKVSGRSGSSDDGLSAMLSVRF